MRDGRHVTTRPIDQVTVPELVRLMANRDLSEHFPKVRGAARRRTAARRDAHVGGALSDISFSLHAGEVLGISGLLGAGRTELARVIAGADRFDNGRIVVDGREVRFRHPADAIARGIGLLPEDRKAQGLVPGLTVARNIALPHGRRLARLGVLSRRCEADLAAPISEELRVKATPTQPVRLLSGGNQQKVVLGKWLAGAGRIFIFDEPTRGVDVGAKVEIYNLMNRLTARGAGIIMISSELPELLGMSDRILVMHRGRIHAELDRAEATEERVLSAALGLASEHEARSRAPVRHADRLVLLCAAAVDPDAALPDRLEPRQRRRADQHQRDRRRRDDVRDHVRRHRPVGRLDRGARRRGARHLAAARPAAGGRAGAGARRRRRRAAWATAR